MWFCKVSEKEVAPAHVSASLFGCRVLLHQLPKHLPVLSVQRAEETGDKPAWQWPLLWKKCSVVSTDIFHPSPWWWHCSQQRDRRWVPPHWITWATLPVPQAVPGGFPFTMDEAQISLPCRTSAQASVAVDIWKNLHQRELRAAGTVMMLPLAVS